jgi:uncharacterized protein (DUF2147 family)
MIRLLLFAVAAIAAAPALAAPDIEGDWVTQDRTALITIAPCGRALCGTIARALIIKPGHPQTDVHNPDPHLRSRKLVGMKILTGFSPGRDRWDKGRIYDPESGKTYRSLLKLNPDRSLKVSGCIAFFCQSQRWTRR